MADGNAVTLRFVFKWKLLLAPQEQERPPYAHFYLSTNFSAQVHVVELEHAQGQMTLSLSFVNNADTNLVRTLSAEQLLSQCDLNVKFFSRTENSYQEAVCNPAGSLILPLHALHSILYEGEGLLDKDITLHMIHQSDRKNKGEVQFRLVQIRSGGSGGGKVAPVSLRGQPAVPVSKTFKKRVQVAIDRTMHMQNINARFIEATEQMYERVRPTMKTVARINSAIWVSNAGVFPPIAYCLDVVRPHIPASFFENCLRVVLERNRMAQGLPSEWQLTGDRPNQEHVLAMENLCGQLLCAYVIQCVYRSDFVYAFDIKTSEYVKVSTEDFGIVTVDHGAGDCEDFARCIIVLYRSLQRLSGMEGVSADLQRIIDFLACYYPFMVLLGVSSAQINATAKDVVEMGAHENCILLPRLRFLRMAASTSPEIDAWMKRKLREEPDSNEVKQWKQSLQYQSIVCEGTGILHAVQKPEDTVHIRKLMETSMTDNTFFALRREYFFSQQDGGFYKSVEKIFLAWPILDPPSMPGFLVMQQHSRDRQAVSKLPVSQLLTKSVSFLAFLKACSADETSRDESVRLLMEPLIKPAEWVAIHRGMVNIHPNFPMEPPGANPAHRQRCDELVSRLLGKLVQGGPAPPPYSSTAQVVTMIYYLRSSKVDQRTVQEVADFLSSQKRKNIVLDWSVHPEWITDEVGGYRIEVLINNAVASQVIEQLQRKADEEERLKHSLAQMENEDEEQQQRILPANVGRIRL